MTLDKDDGDDLIDPAGRVGEAGESFFQMLANSGGGVANKVSRDRLGWDFHLQLQRTSDWRVRHSLDTRPPEASCFVQVKASLRQGRSWPLKLSTWERLAKERRPVFFAVLLFDEESLERPRRVYVVHLGEELLGRVLKALREVPAGEEDSLSHRSLSFTWTEDDALPELTGRELVKAIQRHVGPDVGDYEAKKAQLVKNLGYSDGRLKISFKVHDDKADEEMVALALGLRSDLPVEITRIAEERFGIAKPALGGPSIGGAAISLPDLKPDGNGFATIEARSTGDMVRLPCDFYTAQWLASVLRAEKRGLRIVLDGGEITLMPRGEDLKIELTYSMTSDDERIPLAQAVRRAKVVKLLADPRGCELRLDLGSIGGTSPPFDLSGADVGETALYAEVILSAARLVAAADLDPTIEVQPTKLLEQAKQILTASTRHTIKVSSGQVDSMGDTNAPGVMLLPNEVIIGDYRIRSVVGITGVVHVDLESGRFEVTGVPEIIKVSTCRAEHEDPAKPKLWADAVTEARRRGLVHLLVPRGALDEPGSDELVQGRDP